MLIGIDWGTTSLRAVLCDASGAVHEKIDSGQGILSVGSGGFESVFQSLVSPWLRLHPSAPIIASGMITSRNGWIETPYLDAPAGAEEFATGLVQHDLANGRRVYFVNGLRCEEASGTPDIMRGEETQIFGALTRSGADAGNFLLPGTHSKWAHVRNNQIIGFRTFMTGEVFALLAEQSILGRLARESDGELTAGFRAGVKARQESSDSLLHQLFSARTLALFDRLPAAEVKDYVSGLLIGEEVHCALHRIGLHGGVPLVIIGRGDLAYRYQIAVGMLGRDCEVAADDTTIRGQHLLARKANLI